MDEVVVEQGAVEHSIRCFINIAQDPRYDDHDLEEPHMGFVPLYRNGDKTGRYVRLTPEQLYRMMTYWDMRKRRKNATWSGWVRRNRWPIAFAVSCASAVACCFAAYKAYRLVRL